MTTLDDIAARDAKTNLKRRMRQFDWHDSMCGGSDTTGFDGQPLHIPCDCGMPEMFRSAYESGRAAAFDEAVTRVRQMNGNGRDEPSDPALDAAIAALTRLTEGSDRT